MNTYAGGAVVSWLVCMIPERAVPGQALVTDTVLCSWERHLILTVSLSTQVYKWVPANCWGNQTNFEGVTCDGLPSRPGGLEILLASSCHRNREKFRQLWASHGSNASHWAHTMNTYRHNNQYSTRSNSRVSRDFSGVVLSNVTLDYITPHKLHLGQYIQFINVDHQTKSYCYVRNASIVSTCKSTYLVFSFTIACF